MAFSLKCNVVSGPTVDPAAKSFPPQRGCEGAEEENIKDIVRVARQRIMSEFKEAADSLQQLEMIDAIQKLGLDHLFRQEIKEALHRQFMKHYYCNDIREVNQEYYQSSPHDEDDDDLHEVAVRFRLLRQEGYNVSSDHAFGRFTGKDGKFKQELGKDKQGLMSLFEASHMGVKGEDTLNVEANTFSVDQLLRLLETELGHNDNDVDDQYSTDPAAQSAAARLLISRTLKYPQRKSLNRFTATEFLHELEKRNKGWTNELARIARSEFERNRSLYYNEITHVSRWWKELGLANELKFARNQLLKWYMWSLAALPDPALSEQRIQLTKPISLVYIIDDIFDVYGTPDTLAVFTKAVERWEVNSLDMLPDYMKYCLKALFHTTREISQKIWVKHGFNPFDSLKKAWADLVNAFLVESKWLTSDAETLPTSQEYLQVATTTSGVPLILIHMLLLLGQTTDSSTSMTVSSNDDYRSIIYSTAVILRLWDDFGSAKDEDPNSRDGSYITCYMNEQAGISMEEAKKHVAAMISDEWKQINRECLSLTQHAGHKGKLFSEACLNVARTTPLMYDYDEKHSLPNLEKLIHSLLHQ